MTQYIVHLYREMRLSFAGIEADTPEAAAAMARDRPTSDADDIEDCEGETLTALVDMAGDEDYEHSRFIDFETERHRKPAPKLLAALEDLMEQLIAVGIASNNGDDPELDFGQWASTEGVFFAKARSAIAEAKAAGIRADSAPSQSPERLQTMTHKAIDIQAVLADHRQIAVIWSIEDVQKMRPDLTEDQCWEVLQHTERHHDAAIGINWSVLSCQADMLHGEAPDLDEPEEELP